MSEVASDLAAACAQAMWRDDRACQGLGITINSVGPGRATLSMRVSEAMLNGHGMCHGGFIFALADSAFAYACNSRNARSVAQHCTVTFVQPASRDDTLVAEAQERLAQGRAGITDVRVTAGGAVIAEFRGHSRAIGGTLVASGDVA